MKSSELRLRRNRRHKFVEAISREALVEDEKDVLDLVGACAEFGANRIMLHGEIFSPLFFCLESGQAGRLIQILGKYQIKTAVIFSGDQVRGKFGEFVVETSRGYHCFRTFFSRQEAESWLLCD